MPKFRVLVDVSYNDMLVDADTEEEAVNKVSAYYRETLPFGGQPRLVRIRIREPWKYQLRRLTNVSET
jgi:hypothetical protein